MLPLHRALSPPALLTGSASDPTSSTGETQQAFDQCTNGKFTFPDSDKLIKCRHISVQLVKDSHQSPTGEPDLGAFDQDSLPNHVSLANEKIFGHLLRFSKEKLLIDNDRLGQHLVDSLKSMEQNGVRSKSLLLISLNHTMTINLTIDADETTEASYRVQFHDPNHTVVWLPSAEGSAKKMTLDEVQQLRTGSFLKSEEQTYFGDANTAMLCPTDSAQFEQFESPTFDPDTETATGFTEIDFTMDTMNASHLYHILISGNQENLDNALELLKQIKKTDPLRFKNIVFGQDLSNTFLSNALRDRDLKILQFSGQLFALIDQKDRAEFLIAVNRDGMDVLYHALESNRVDIIEAYAPLLEMVPAKDRAALLMVKNRDWDDGLYTALKHGNAAAITAFCTLLEKIPEQDRAAVLLAKSADNDDGLYHALVQGHDLVIAAYGKLIAMVPLAERAILLSAKTGLFVTDGLYVALMSRHFAAANAYAELVRQVAVEDRAALLSAKNVDGVDILYKALEEQDADIIDLYGEIIAGVPQSDLPQLLMAKDGAGGDGLFKALEGGADEAITAYGKLVFKAAETDRPSLLSAKNKEGVEGLDQAKKNHHREAIAAYLALRSGAD